MLFLIFHHIMSPIFLDSLCRLKFFVWQMAGTALVCCLLVGCRYSHFGRRASQVDVASLISDDRRYSVSHHPWNHNWCFWAVVLEKTLESPCEPGSEPWPSAQPRWHPHLRPAASRTVKNGCSPGTQSVVLLPDQWLNKAAIIRKIVWAPPYFLSSSGFPFK